MIHQNTDRPRRRHVSQVQRLDLAHLRRLGVFRSPPGTVHTIRWDHVLFQHFPVSVAVVADDSGPLGLVVNHRTLDTFEMVTYLIPLESTPCHLGGRRYWFRCPGPSEDVRCGSRRRVLYQRDGGHQFACTACHNLHYRNPTSGLFDRAMAVLLDAAGTPEGRDWLSKARRGTPREQQP